MNIAEGKRVWLGRGEASRVVAYFDPRVRQGYVYSFFRGKFVIFILATIIKKQFSLGE